MSLKWCKHHGLYPGKNRSGGVAKIGSFSESKPARKTVQLYPVTDFNILFLPDFFFINNVVRRAFPLKIKFLEKAYNAYFSVQFFRGHASGSKLKLPYYEKKL